MRLEAEALTRRAGGRPIVDGVTFALRPGEFLALVGPNGSGKSTLISMLAGLRRPHAGRLTLDGRPIADWRRADLARVLALVEQQAETAERLTAREVVELGRTPHLRSLRSPGERDRAVVDAALAAVDMEALAGRLWPSLSGGERQRLHIARALAQEPRLLLLDEPTNHLDVEHQLGLLALLRHRGASVIAALHDLDHAALFADRVLVMERGRLAALGPPAEVLTPERIAAVFRVRASVERDADGRCRIRYAAPAAPAER